jgi:hypothetical protein
MLFIIELGMAGVMNNGSMDDTLKSELTMSCAMVLDWVMYIMTALLKLFYH